MFGSSFFRNLSEIAKAPSKKQLADKVAVITASTQGIGFAIAERFCREGAKVVVSSRHQNNIDAAVEKLKRKGFPVIGVPCHVGVARDRENLIEKTMNEYNSVDILVSNAAVNPTWGGILQCSDKAWNKILDTNVTSALELCKVAAPKMLEKNTSCSILFVSSVVAYNQIPVLSAYSVSKTLLVALTKSLGLELAKTNIRVNCLAPGNVVTNFSNPLIGVKNAFSSQGSNGNQTSQQEMNEALIELNKETLSGIPMGRSAEPSEMAGVALFLCSDDASYVTGETVVASGGILTRL